MKKLYSLTLALTLGFAATLNAQTTITATAIPQIGYTYNMNSDTAAADLPTFTVSAGSGVAQTWNYTSEFANVFGESTAFVAAASGVGSANFPSSTMAADIGGNWIYFYSNTNGLFIDGAHATIQGSTADVDYSPDAYFIPTPFTYNNVITNMYQATFTTTNSGQTVQVHHVANQQIKADAFGSLTTPTGTYPNTLRMQTCEATIDSIFLNILGSWNFVQAQVDSTTTYRWLQNSSDAQLLQIELDKTGAVTKAQYLQSLSFGITQYAQKGPAFNLFPNPTSGSTYLTYENKNSGQVSLQLVDLDGRLVGNLLNEEQAVGAQKVFINLESMHLPKGMYFLHLKNSSGLQTIKLSVN